MGQTNATQFCEDILSAGIQYNLDHRILPSENAVAERLLARRLELEDAYAELFDKVEGSHPAVQVFLGLLLGAAAFRNPKATAKAREARTELTVVNEEIAQTARQLQTLLERRDEIHNTTDFSADTHYHVCDVIADAARHVPLFDSWIRARLQALTGRFDLKYWPSIADFVGELADDAEQAQPQAHFRAAAAATHGRRASPTDFFGYLFEELKNMTTQYGGFIPKGFDLSDRTLASLASCALDCDADAPFDAAYVKRLRQRLRERTEA